MGKTSGAIHPEAKSSPAVNLGKQTIYVLPKCNGGTGIGQTFLCLKGEIGKKEEVTVPKQV